MFLSLLLLLPAPSCAVRPVAKPVAVTRQDDLESLKRKLRSDDDWDRRRAIEALAKLDSGEAWDLIFETLEDPKAMIADAAQMALGSTSSAEVIDQLLTSKRGIQSKKESVRVRAVEAIGRLRLQLEGNHLLKSLKAKSPMERRRMCWSIERLCLAGHAPTDEKKRLAKELQRLAERDKDDEVRAAATIALAALHPDRRQELFLASRSSRSVPLQIAALELSPPEKGAETAVGFSDSETRAVRVAAVQALAALAAEGDREAMAHLIDRLEQELNKRLAWRIVSKLQRFSGRKSGRDVRAWRAWWEVAQDDWEGIESGEREFELDAGERSSSFVGLPLLSDQLAFLIDFSGSIWKKTDGETRKGRVDIELQRALESLPKSASFELIPFTDDPFPWKEKLTPANPKRVKEASEWFRKQKMSGKGDYLDAAEVALRIPEVDTQVILGDGAPSGGELWDLKLLVPWLLEQNRFRQVSFDIVLVDPGKYLIQHWERLAAATDGRVLVVE